MKLKTLTSLILGATIMCSSFLPSTYVNAQSIEKSVISVQLEESHLRGAKPPSGSSYVNLSSSSYTAEIVL